VLRGGASFASIAYGTSVNRNMFCFCEAVKTAAGVDLWRDLGDWPEEVVYRWLYWVGPDHKTISHYGHHKRSFNYNVVNDNQERMMYWLAHHFRGTRTGALAQGWLKDGSPFARANPGRFDRLLLGDAAAPSETPHKLPLTYLSEYRGELVTRSDWTSDATWVSFRCGKTHTGEFFRPDAGHFNLFKGGDRLTADAGSDDYSWGAHTSGFRNTIVIGGKTQLNFRTWTKETGYARMWQKTPEVLAKKAQIVRDYEESFGKIVAMEDRGEYVYVAGDFAGAYNVPGKLDVAKTCTRQVLYIRPGTVVLFDRVVPKDASVVEWRCHVPTQEQGRPWGRARHTHKITLADRDVTVNARTHQMVCRTVLPQKVKVSMTPTNTLYGNKGFGGWQMITVATASPVKETRFLHVLQIDPHGKAGGLLTSAAVADDKVILKLGLRGRNHEIAFNAAGDCGGSVKTGAGPAVAFAQRIVPERILVNKP